MSDLYISWPQILSITFVGAIVAFYLWFARSVTSSFRVIFLIYVVLQVTKNEKIKSLNDKNLNISRAAFGVFLQNAAVLQPTRTPKQFHIDLALLAMRVYKTTQINRQQRRDQQGNVFTISDEAAANRYNDIFYIEPNSDEAARIRAQLEKDDKELPSYDEVMRMCNLTTPTAAAASEPTSIDMPGSVVMPSTVAALPAVPPYSETDPNLTPGGSVEIEMTSITVPSDSVATPSSQRDVSEQTGSWRLTQTVSNSVV